MVLFLSEFQIFCGSEIRDEIEGPPWWDNERLSLYYL